MSTFKTKEKELVRKILKKHLILYPSWCRGITTALILLLPLVLVIRTQLLYAQSQQLKFEHLSIIDGLSQNSINCILQDNKGFMWFGTQDGLNKYDGYGFTIYKHDFSNPNSLSDNFVLSLYQDKSNMIWVGTNGGGLNRFDPILEAWTPYLNKADDPKSLCSNFVNAICEDAYGDLWIGTNDGLNRFDRITGAFTHFKHVPDDSSSLSHHFIYTIYEDRKGDLWIGTGLGLNRFNRETSRFSYYQSYPNTRQGLSHNTVYSIHEDRNGFFWIGTAGGLNRFEPIQKRFTHYTYKSSDHQSLIQNSVRSIHEDKTGILWIGTDEGLSHFDPINETFVHYRHDPNDPNSLSNSIVRSIYGDNSEVLWIGTYGGGVNRLNREKEKFTLYRKDATDPNSLNSNSVWSIHEGRDDQLWIGTEDGLNRFDRKRGTFVQYTHVPNDIQTLSQGIVRAIHEDASGTLWVGTYGGGLNRFDKNTGRFSHYTHVAEDNESLSTNFIRTIYEDRYGVLWIGTNNGLNKFNRKTKSFLHFKQDADNPHSLNNNRVRSIFEDNSGILWIGTYGGLHRFNRDTEQFVRYTHDPNDSHSLSNDRVSIYQDPSGTLWIGTLGGGLNRFDRAKEQFTHYTEKDGLPNNSVYGILSDKNGHLWVSTNSGLSRFNPETKTFRNYNVQDGLQSNEFNGGAYCMSSSGEMFFGGINGMNSFFPDSIKTDRQLPPVVITDFRILNQRVPVGRGPDGRTVLEKSITETDFIRLSHKDKVITFEFAALHYSPSNKNEYAYIMEGFDQNWNFIGNRRIATYTNLPPGHYTFRVKASNNDGIWNEGNTILQIRVVPPLWNTLGFRICLIIVIILSGFMIYQIRTRAIQERNRILEERVVERTSTLRHINRKLQKEIATRQRAEQALKIEKAYMEQLFENAPEAIVMTDTDGSILRVNNEFTRIFGYTLEEVLGRHVDDLLAPKPRMAEANTITGQMIDGKNADLESVRQRKDKTSIHVSILGAPIFVDDELVALYGIYRDISDRIRAQKKQKRLMAELDSANQELKDFAYIVSHDLKAPLRAIASLVDWLYKDYETLFDEEGTEMLTLLTGRVKRMNELIEGILQYSRVGRIREEKSEVNLNHLIGDVKELMAPPLNIDIEVREDLPSVICEKTRMVQVFENLISNAIKYMDKPRGEIKIGCTSQSDQWKFSVSDNGPGIDEKYHEKIFQIFQTLAPRDEVESTGVGLSVVKKIVEMYNGKVWVESQAGQGSTFYFTWPKNLLGGQNA